MAWTKDDVDRALAAIEAEIDAVRIPDDLLDNFTDSNYDREIRAYLSSSKERYYRFFPLLVRKLGLRNVVELGTRDGASANCIYAGLPPDGLLVTVDIDARHKLASRQLIDDPRVTFAIGDVCDLATFSGEVPFDIDFLFCDTVHTARQLESELNVYRPLLASPALIAIDDINLNDKRRPFDEWPGAKWDLTELCHGSGFGLLLFEPSGQLPRIERLLAACQASVEVWRQRCEELQLELNVAIAPKDSIAIRFASAVLPKPVKTFLRKAILRR